MNEKLRKKAPYFIIFFISMVFRMVQIAGEYEMRLISDDIGMLSSPAYLAGYDWSDAVSTTNYYGAAYYMLFTPILKYIDNPCTVWFIIVFSNLTIQALTCVLSYHIAVRHLKFKAGLGTALAAILCSLVVDTYPAMSQEPVLFFLTWLIAYILVKMTDEHENRSRAKLCRYSVVLALACAYAYLVHSRTIVFIAALFPVLVLLACYNRDNIRCLFLFTITLFICMFLAKMIQNGVISLLWGAKETEMGNAKVSVDQDTIKTMLTPAGFRVMADMFVSNLFTAAGRTFGANIIAIVMGGMLVTGMKIKKCSIHIMLNAKVMLLFSLTCYLLGVAGVCVVWGKGVVPTYFTNKVSYGYKGFAYFRYSATFLGPGALVAVGECFHNTSLCTKMKLPVLVSEIFIVWYYFLFIIEKIKNSQFVNDAIVSYLDVEIMGFDVINYRITVLVLFASSFLFFIKMKGDSIMRKAVMALYILCSLLPYVGDGSGLLPKPQLKSSADGGYYLIKFLEETDVMPKAIYCPSGNLIRFYQYHLKEYPISLGYPKEGNQEIVFTDKAEKGAEISEDFMAVQLDGNEWVWTDDDELYEMINNYVNQVG